MLHLNAVMIGQYFENMESEGAKNLYIEKIAFKAVLSNAYY